MYKLKSGKAGMLWGIYCTFRDHQTGLVTLKRETIAKFTGIYPTDITRLNQRLYEEGFISFCGNSVLLLEGFIIIPPKVQTPSLGKLGWKKIKSKWVNEKLALEAGPPPTRKKRAPEPEWEEGEGGKKRKIKRKLSSGGQQSAPKREITLTDNQLVVTEEQLVQTEGQLLSDSENQSVITENQLSPPAHHVDLPDRKILDLDPLSLMQENMERERVTPSDFKQLSKYRLRLWYDFALSRGRSVRDPLTWAKKCRDEGDDEVLELWLEIEAEKKKQAEQRATEQAQREAKEQEAYRESLKRRASTGEPLADWERVLLDQPTAQGVA
jgi:hypothetical protein